MSKEILSIGNCVENRFVQQMVTDVFRN